MRATDEIIGDALAAKAALARASSELKNRALAAMADALLDSCGTILEANAADIKAARESLGEVMLDRLLLTPRRIEGMAEGIRALIGLPDPVGRVLARIERPNGLVIEKTAVPMGVIAIIYESRPNVTADAAALALKAGSSCVLRSGKQARRSAFAIVAALQKGLAAAGLPETAISLVEDESRKGALELMKASGKIDLLIPRGGAALIRACVENATVPCIETGTGICHIYVDRSADLAMALGIVENAKTSRPSVCNACEVCLVHADAAAEFLPMLRERLARGRALSSKPPVELRLSPRAAAFTEGTPAGEHDFDTEFLDYILAVEVVESLDAALAHIARHGTHHSDAIVAEDAKAVAAFIAGVDSAAVYVNASTRFTDGGEFGLGCEMGISTQKLHARGPMGVEELCSYKYIVRGAGQIRE